MKKIPVINLPASFAVESMRLMAPEARAMVQKAIPVALKPAIWSLDRVSKSFLERSNQSHREEIAEVAQLLGVPGAYFFNVHFEWGCTVKAYQTARGPELVRVLDWSTPGLGSAVVMFRVASAFGPWYTLSWPGFAGIVHGIARGRFAIAMNQAPLTKHTGIFPLDWAKERKKTWDSKGMLPAHLLRKVMEEAPNYKEAYALLASEPLCVPAIFSIVGIRDGEHAIIERTRETMRNVAGVSAANHFDFQPDGYHRGEHSWGRSALLSAIECDPEDIGFMWLQRPILNAMTVLAFIANPSKGTIIACGIEDGRPVTETLSMRI